MKTIPVFREDERGKGANNKRDEVTESAKKKKKNNSNEREHFLKIISGFSEDEQKIRASNERREKITESAKMKKQNITNEGENFSKLSADIREDELEEENIEKREEITESAKKKNYNIINERENLSKVTADFQENERGEEAKNGRREEITDSAKKKKQINYKIEKCYLNINSNGLITLRNSVIETERKFTESNQSLRERLKLKRTTEQKIEEQLKFYNIKPSFVVLERLKIPQKIKDTQKKEVSTFNKSESRSELMNENNSENTSIQQISFLDGSKTDFEPDIFENQLKISKEKPILRKNRLHKKTLKRIRKLANFKSKKSIISTDDSNSDLESKKKKSMSPRKENVSNLKILGENRKKRIIASTESETDSDFEIAANKSKLSKNTKNVKKLNLRTKHIFSDLETECDGNSTRKQVLTKQLNTDDQGKITKNKISTTNTEIVTSIKLNNYGELKISKKKLKLSDEKQIFKMNIDIEKVLPESSNSETNNKSQITKIKSRKRIITEESDTEEEIINLPVKNISIPIERCDSVNFLAQEINSRRKINETNNNNRSETNRDDCDTTMEIQIGSNFRHNDNLSDDSDVEKIDKIFTFGTSIDSDNDLFGNVSSGNESTIPIEREIVKSFNSLEVQPSTTRNNLIEERNLNVNGDSEGKEENSISSREFLQNSLNIRKEKEIEPDLLDSDDRQALLEEDSETDFEDTVQDNGNINSSVIEVEVKKKPVEIILITLDDVQNSEENNCGHKEEDYDCDIQIAVNQETPEINEVNKNPITKIQEETQIEIDLNQERIQRNLKIKENVESENFTNEFSNQCENLNPSQSLISQITKHSQLIETKNLIQIEKQSQHYILNDESIEQEERNENESMENSTSHLEKSSEFLNSSNQVDNNTEDEENHSTIDSERQIFTQFDRKRQRKVHFGPNHLSESNEQEILSNELEIDSNNQINFTQGEITPKDQVFETNRDIHLNQQNSPEKIQENQQEIKQIDQENNRETNRESNQKISQETHQETNRGLNKKMSQETNWKTSQETNLKMIREANREMNQQKISLDDNQEINDNLNRNKDKMDRKNDSQNDNRKMTQKTVEDHVDSDCSDETIIYESINKIVMTQKKEKDDNWSNFLADIENNSHNGNKNYDNEKENSIKINFKADEQKLLPKITSFWEDWNSSDSS